MASKRKTSKDYRKEFLELENQKKALEAQIFARTVELIKANPDLSYEEYESNHPEIYFSEYVDLEKYSTETGLLEKYGIDNALNIMAFIEEDIASKHPHKQTKIEFPVGIPLRCSHKHRYGKNSDYCIYCGIHINDA